VMLRVPAGVSGRNGDDALRPYFAASAFAREIVAKLDTDGYAVLPGVFSGEEADAGLHLAWSFVEKVSPGIRRHNWRTWYGSRGQDPWPQSQRDMMQLHQAGWVFADLKEMFAERVFERLYGTRELHCSKDGFTFQRPTWQELGRNPNDHFDQGSSQRGLQCVQGSVALTDQEEADGCFLVWPGSHRYREEILEACPAGRRRPDFIILGEQEKDILRSAGIRPIRVPVKKGDVILWRSDVCHCGAPPIGSRETFRLVAYVCCLPAALTPEPVYEMKKRAFDRLETGSHWPCREEWFEKSSRNKDFLACPYFDQLPVLSNRQQELFGLVRYSNAPAAECDTMDTLCEGETVEKPPESHPGQGRSRGRRRWQKRNA